MEGVQLQGEVARQRAEIDKDVKVARLSEQDDIGYFNISTGRQSTEILWNIVVGVIPVERQESVVSHVLSIRRKLEEMKCIADIIWTRLNFNRNSDMTRMLGKERGKESSM